MHDQVTFYLLCRRSEIDKSYNEQLYMGCRSEVLWHTSGPYIPTCKINYVNMQHDYVHMRLIYVDMLIMSACDLRYVACQHNYLCMFIC